MLKINNNVYKILLSEIKYINATNNNLKGYSVLVSFDIEYNNKKGYFNFFVDFFDDNNIKNIENKTYIESSTGINSKITLIEIFDIFEFIDFIDGKIIVEFGEIMNNKIKAKLVINDPLVKIDYEGMLDIK